MMLHISECLKNLQRVISNKDEDGTPKLINNIRERVVLYYAENELCLGNGIY